MSKYPVLGHLTGKLNNLSSDPFNTLYTTCVPKEAPEIYGWDEGMTYTVISTLIDKIVYIIKSQVENEH